MKTRIIFVLSVVIGLAVLGAGPASFIDNVGAGGMFLFSAVKGDSASVIPASFIDNVGAGGMFLFSSINGDSVLGLADSFLNNVATGGMFAFNVINGDFASAIPEKGTFSLIPITNNPTKLLSVTTDNMTKEKQAEMEIHRLINLEREKHGLKILGYDEELASIAKSHSIDMANDEYFSHETPEGLNPTDRASKVDYVCQYQIDNFIYSGIGENLHMVQGSAVSFLSTPESIAELAVSGWMDSPGHKKNILTSNFSKEGIGVSILPFTIHVTQNFC